jgi:hypothetical protein
MLPFATLGANRFKNFTKNMEMAAILYLAESHRKKGESQLLKKTDEKLVFIAEACYPLWLVPYNRATLVFDGLGLVSHTLSYDVARDVEIFNKDIKRNRRSTEAYTATLTRNIDYFSSFQGKEEIRIEGLVAIPELKETLRHYLPLMKEAKKPFRTTVALRPTVKSCEIQAGIRQLSTLRKKIDDDIKSMEAGMTFLNSATARRVKAIRDEIRKSRETHRKKIKRTKLRSTKRLLRIQAQYNRRITKTSKKFKKKLLRLNRNQVNLKRELRNLRKLAKRCEAKLRSGRSRSGKRSENQWTLKLERTKKKLQALVREIEVNRKRIRVAENAQKLELAKHRIACCTRIESANKMFRDLQGSREAEVIMKRQEIATLEEVTRCITKSMQEMIQNKRLFRAEFDKIVMPRGRQGCRRLVYMPFYLVRYERGDKTRYVVCPPLVVKDGVLARMKVAFRGAKVKALVQSRSEAIAAFLNQLVPLMDRKPLFEKRVTEAGIRKSILLGNKLRAGLAKGLKELESEDWISKSELRAFSKILYMYASSMNQRTSAAPIPEDDYLEFLPAYPHSRSARA